MTCARCGADLRVGASTMSYFNTDIICLDCRDREARHPLYAFAVATECEAVKAGDYNFPGIGKPEDL